MYNMSMPKQIHVLEELNVETAEATCRNCGPVTAKKLHDNSFRCPIGHKKNKGQWTKGIGYISTAEREFRLEAQGGVCAICQKKAVLHRDHDHMTGKDRAFLCHGCNVGLGHFMDNPELLEAAAAYLRYHDKDHAPFQQDVVVDA